MKSLKSKASRFFKDQPSQDEKVANTGADASVDFDAGIEGHIKKKPSRFFTRKSDKVDKPLPSPPPYASSSTLALDVEAQVPRSRQELSASNAPFRFPRTSSEASASSELLLQTASHHGSVTPEPESLKVKPRPSFANLRTTSSRLFGNRNLDSSSPPQPPVPQIPVDFVESPPRRPVLTSLHTSRRSRSSISIPRPLGTISRPMLVQQYSSPPIPENPSTVAFIKRPGPPPQRPSRPDSLDDDTIAFMQQGCTRMVLHGVSRLSSSTVSSSTTRSHASSIEARLGLHSYSGSSTRTGSLESPLAARFPLDIHHPLPIRDSTGSVRTSHFSQFVRNECGGYAGDGVDEEDRDLGPIEQYDQTKENEWKLVKRVSSGPNGNPGMLFRDKMGAFHFVADI
ncbi:hypothetical protein DE146DRAFT_768315 [Phaeosphaeria sp. MPI-PUGE-AT-0046c]|nr:hypothetical protein DE146DRAFT_768315 [Phaeosphaeria sp. MPI-PUGE-AT-0046c]